MRKTLTTVALALMAGQSYAANPTGPFNSSMAGMLGAGVAFSNEGQHESAGHCVSHYALIAAHATLRADGIELDGWCKKPGPVGSRAPEDFHVVCNGNRNPEAADRLFAAGRQYFLDMLSVSVSEADVKAICTTTPATIRPATRLEVPTSGR